MFALLRVLGSSYNLALSQVFQQPNLSSDVDDRANKVPQSWSAIAGVKGENKIRVIAFKDLGDMEANRSRYR